MLSVVMTTISVRPRTMRIQSTTFCPVVMLGTSFQWRKEGRAKQPKVTAKLPTKEMMSLKRGKKVPTTTTKTRTRMRTSHFFQDLTKSLSSLVSSLSRFSMHSTGGYAMMGYEKSEFSESSAAATM